MQINGITMLADLLDHLDGGKPMPSLSASGIVAAVRHSLASGDSLDAAMGLHRAGRSNHLASRLANTRRNGFLVQAVNSLRADGVTDWQCCKQLAVKIKVFESGVDWKTTRYQGAPPGDWPDWKRFLWWAKSTDLNLPTSARQLRTIVLKTAQFNPHGETEKLLASKLSSPMQNAISLSDRKH